MRAFIAILKDSFREAMASRVLWIALVVIVVVLLALSPIGLRTERSLRLRQQELKDPEQLVQSLAEPGADLANRSAIVHLRNLLNENDSERLKAWTSKEESENRGTNRRGRGLRRDIVEMLNRLRENESFYDAEAFSSLNLDEEIVAQLTAGETESDDYLFASLTTLARVFPESIQLKDDPATVVTYLGTDMTDPVDLLPSQFRMAMDGIIVGVLSVFLGFFGIFGSLLVTASIIPRTFEPGEISLLLSKPVSRTLLFLTKFLGGCIFTLLCATLLVTGVWLILGSRLGEWRTELLWCIPVYVFLFAIYFSVSAVTGAIWRNANVSLILVIVFWICLFVIGATHGFMSENIIKSQRIIEITSAGNQLITVDGSRSVFRWDEDRKDWEEIFKSDGQGMPRILQRLMMSGVRFLPVYDFRNERIIALQTQPSRFGGLSAATVVSGSELGGWERESEGTTPGPVLDLLIDKTGRILLPASGGIYQFNSRSDEQKQTSEYLSKVTFGLFNGKSSDAFVELQTEKIPRWTANASACLDATTGQILILDEGTVHTFVSNEEGKYDIGPTREILKDASGLIACTGNVAMAAFSDGTIHLLDSLSLETIAESKLPDDGLPLVVTSDRIGRTMALLSHDGHVVLADVEQKTLMDWKSNWNGRVSAIAFDNSGHLLTSDGRKTVMVWDGTQQLTDQTKSGHPGWTFPVFDYVVNPLHSILPRPSDMDNAVRYLITGERSAVIDANNDGPANAHQDLRKDRIKLDVWRPIATNAVFICVVLAFGCVYLKYYDF
ncbi:MAG: ABC transporter permease subunit [Planctomycetaceae bacterium]